MNDFHFSRTKRVLTIIQSRDAEGDMYYVFDFRYPRSAVVEQDWEIRGLGVEYTHDLLSRAETIVKQEIVGSPGGTRWAIARDLSTALRNLADFADEDIDQPGLPAATRELGQ